MQDDRKQNIVTLLAFVVVSCAVTGYFVGLQAPMNSMTSGDSAEPTIAPHQHGFSNDEQAILATSYSDMAAATRIRARKMQTALADLKSNVDLMSEFTATPAQKLVALQSRKKSRAFNGAPPTIPHPVDQRSVDACIACHGKGAKTESLRVPKMSHQFLTNCTQCHVESDPQHQSAELFGENEFRGLPAPSGGSRAFAGAPPQIPHSTWMRSDCMSCHGPSGSQGIRTTHPWRQNCQQCHAPSAALDQTMLGSEPQFLPPPKVED